ncbi:hypothetical protein C9439_05820 [archaeon SCG-AAA382B04]|nr:hypothetical protein C9439_05820 [archaeon SCG-AAA382B04]
MNKKIKTISIISILSLLILFATPIEAAKAQEVTLLCPCDCGDELTSCECANAKETQMLVQKWRDNGLSEAEVVDKYAERFGDSFVQKNSNGNDLESSALSIEANLVCNCGCSNVIRDCSCETASQVHEWVTSQVQKGVDSEEIYSQYADRHGDKFVTASYGVDLINQDTIIVLVVIGGLGAFMYLKDRN